MTAARTLDWRRSREFRAHPAEVVDVEDATWTTLAARAAQGSLTMLGLWPDGAAMVMALHDPDARAVALARRRARRGGKIQSIGDVHPAAQRLERAAADLAGLTFEDSPDPRPWLDHGRWEIAHPLGRAEPHPGHGAYRFLPVSGESLHQVPVGPVHAGIIEPGHFRFTAQGETVVRLEERLGYVHKGIETLMRGAGLARGAELAGRVSGDSTVAYAWAFAQAAEAALEIEVPERAF
ncbi:MAG: hydrogenase expression protein HypE, partial [Alphaproteobacteria bacterium]